MNKELKAEREMLIKELKKYQYTDTEIEELKQDGINEALWQRVMVEVRATVDARRGYCK